MQSITVAGVDISKERYPNLYLIAKRDPEALKTWLEELKERTGSESIEMTATMLEMDLEHERLS